MERGEIMDDATVGQEPDLYDIVEDAKEALDSTIESLSKVVTARDFLDTYMRERCDKLQSALNDLLDVRTKLH